MMTSFVRFSVFFCMALPITSFGQSPSDSKEMSAEFSGSELVSSLSNALHLEHDGYNKGGFIGSLFGAKWACRSEVFFDPENRMALRIRNAAEPGMASADFENPSLDATFDFGIQADFQKGQYSTEEVKLTGPENLRAKFVFSNGKPLFTEVKKDLFSTWWCESL